MAGSSTIELILDDANWMSTISVSPNVTPMLGGLVVTPTGISFSNSTLRVAFSDSVIPAQLVGATLDLFDWGTPLDPANRFEQVDLPPGTVWDLSRLYDTGEIVLTAVLQPGDANRDLSFDQLDIVQVLQVGRYLTGGPADWGEGDWNGDGVFDQRDIVAALAAGAYGNGSYAAIAPGGVEGDEQTSIIYDPTTGEIAIDAPASTELTSINIDSDAAIFTGEPAQNLGGSWGNTDSDNNIFRAAFGSSFGWLSFGYVAQTGLTEEFVRNDLTVVGSLLGGGDLGEVDLIYLIYECRGALFSDQGLTGADFSGQDLTGACFVGTTLVGADLSGANLSGANLQDSNFTDADLAGANLAGARLWYSTLTNANLSGANLSGARLYESNFTDADLSGADLRKLSNWYRWARPSTVTRNAILPAGFPLNAGYISELNLLSGDTLVIRDAEKGIRVYGSFQVDADAVLDVIVEDSGWRSTITVAPDVTPQLGGTLRIRFGSDTNSSELVGTTFDLFDWTGAVDESNRFAQVVLPSGTRWDVSRFYATGEVTLTALLQPGDANGDLTLDQNDLAQLLQAGKYLFGEHATWEEGDWNGDHVFNQLDIVAALQTGDFMQGPYAALAVDAAFAATGA